MNTVEIDIRIVDENGEMVGDEHQLRPLAADVIEGARRTGWDEKTKDQSLIDAAKDAKAAFDASQADRSPDGQKKTALLAAKLQVAQAAIAAAPLIDNPVTYTDHVLEAGMFSLSTFLYSEEEVESEINAKYDKIKADEKKAEKEARAQAARDKLRGAKA